MFDELCGWKVCRAIGGKLIACDRYCQDHWRPCLWLNKSLFSLTVLSIGFMLLLPCKSVNIVSHNQADHPKGLTSQPYGLTIIVYHRLDFCLPIYQHLSCIILSNQIDLMLIYFWNFEYQMLFYYVFVNIYLSGHWYLTVCHPCSTES